MFYDNWKVGDMIAYSINVNGRMTGESKECILDETLLRNIQRYEDETNQHNWRKIE